MIEKIKSEDFYQGISSDPVTLNSLFVIDCKYYLPCGKCDKTNELCQIFRTNDVCEVKKNDSVNN